MAGERDRGVEPSPGTWVPLHLGVTHIGSRRGRDERGHVLRAQLLQRAVEDGDRGVDELDVVVGADRTRRVGRGAAETLVGGGETWLVGPVEDPGTRARGWSGRRRAGCVLGMSLRLGQAVGVGAEERLARGLGLAVWLGRGRDEADDLRMPRGGNLLTCLLGGGGGGARRPDGRGAQSDDQPEEGLPATQSLLPQNPLPPGAPI